jgi:hypothetical protein
MRIDQWFSLKPLHMHAGVVGTTIITSGRPVDFLHYQEAGWPMQFVIASQTNVGKTAPRLQHNAV